MPEGEEEEQEIENLFEKIMENFSNLAKILDFEEVQEAQRIPKKLDPRRNTPRHIIITLPKIKDKRIFFKKYITDYSIIVVPFFFPFFPSALYLPPTIISPP